MLNPTHETWYSFEAPLPRWLNIYSTIAQCQWSHVYVLFDHVFVQIRKEGLLQPRLARAIRSAATILPPRLRSLCAFFVHSYASVARYYAVIFLSASLAACHSSSCTYRRPCCWPCPGLFLTWLVYHCRWAMLLQQTEAAIAGLQDGVTWLRAPSKYRLSFCNPDLN